MALAGNPQDGWRWLGDLSIIPVRHNRQIGSYFGLVPCEDSSAGKQRLGHITRQGPSLVRRLLCEAAWQAIRRDSRVRERYQTLKQGDKQRRKIALVAMAHYLLRAM